MSASVTGWNALLSETDLFLPNWANYVFEKENGPIVFGLFEIWRN